MSEFIPPPESGERSSTGEDGMAWLKDAMAQQGVSWEAFEGVMAQKRKGQSSGAEHPVSESERQHIDVQSIIGKVENDRCRHGLESEDPQIVGAVITAVRQARAEAQEAGQQLSDREIYLAYRKAIETDEPDPRVVQACSVLTNFMGDNPLGKLPF